MRTTMYMLHVAKSIHAEKQQKTDKLIKTTLQLRKRGHLKDIETAFIMNIPHSYTKLYRELARNMMMKY